MGAFNYKGGVRFNIDNVKSGSIEEGFAHARTVIKNGMADPTMSHKLLDFQAKVLPFADKIYITNIRTDLSFKQDIKSRFPDARPNDHVIMETINGNNSFIIVDVTPPTKTQATVYEYRASCLDITQGGILKILARENCGEANALRKELLRSKPGAIAQCYRYC